MNEPLLIRNVRPWATTEATDVLIDNGIIKTVAPHQPADSTIQVIDGDRQILLPGFVDAHTHIDKTFWGQPWQPHRAGPRLIDKIDNERSMRAELQLSVETQAGNQIRQAISKGTTHIRTHVDVASDIGLRHIEAVLAVREQLRDLITLQIVAFPQSGMLIQPGIAAQLEEAISMGADLIGGIDPSSMDRNPVGHLDTIFGIAERHAVGVDIHLHEPGELGAFAVELIAERTRALGLQGRVTISHAFCLGMVGDAYLEQLIGLLLENNIAIMTHAPGNHPFPPVKRLAEAGVRLCSGSDGIRDAWGPYGNADMLERAMLLGYRSNYRRDDELELTLNITTRGGAEVMAAEGYGVEPGCRADLVIVRGETLAHAVVERDPRRLVIKNGRVVARDGDMSDLTYRPV